MPISEHKDVTRFRAGLVPVFCQKEKKTSFGKKTTTIVIPRDGFFLRLLVGTSSFLALAPPE